MKSGNGFSWTEARLLTATRKKIKDKLANALARGQAVRRKMARDEGGSISTHQAARLLGMTPQTVLNLYHRGKLLGWRDKSRRAVRIPLWQFVQHKRLPGLEKVLAQLNSGDVLDDWGRVGFFLQSHGLLDERRPVDLLRQNKLELVLKAAEAYGG